MVGITHFGNKKGFHRTSSWRSESLFGNFPYQRSIEAPVHIPSQGRPAVSLPFTWNRKQAGRGNPEKMKIADFCRKGNISNEESFYIASFPMSAKDAARYVQAHWGIENRLHWSLDMVFHEDDCKIHTDNAPQNLSVLRKMAKVILQNDTSRKVSIRRKSNIALMDNDYAFHLMFSATNLFK